MICRPPGVRQGSAEVARDVRIPCRLRLVGSRSGPLGCGVAPRWNRLGDRRRRHAHAAWNSGVRRGHGSRGGDRLRDVPIGPGGRGVLDVPVGGHLVRRCPLDPLLASLTLAMKRGHSRALGGEKRPLPDGRSLGQNEVRFLVLEQARQGENPIAREEEPRLKGLENRPPAPGRLPLRPRKRAAPAGTLNPKLFRLPTAPQPRSPPEKVDDLYAGDLTLSTCFRRRQILFTGSGSSDDPDRPWGRDARRRSGTVPSTWFRPAARASDWAAPDGCRSFRWPHPRPGRPP